MDKVKSTLPGLPSPVIPLFVMPAMSKSLINDDNDSDYYEAFMKRQNKADKKYDTLRELVSLPIALKIVV